MAMAMTRMMIYDLEKEAKEVEAMKGDVQGEKQSENGRVEDDV